MRKLYLVAAIALIAVISACQQQAAAGPNTASPFFGGTNGLLIRFVENAPPAEILDGAQFPFNVILELENAGEWDIVKFTIAESPDGSPSGSAPSNKAHKIQTNISGLFAGDFSGKTSAGVSSSLATGNFNEYVKDGLVAVQKDSEGNKIPGERVLVSYPSMSVGVPDEGSEMSYTPTLRGNIQLPVRADVCYSYGTKVSTQYCLRRDTTSTQGGVCSVNGPKTVYNSAAPVQVATMTENAAGKSALLLTFKVTHNGNGRLFKPGTGCEAAFTRKITDENRVSVLLDSGLAGATLNAEDFVCRGLISPSSPTAAQEAGELRLSNGQGVFTCTLKTDKINADAVKEMVITITYDYLESKTTNLLVKHLI